MSKQANCMSKLYEQIVDGVMVIDEMRFCTVINRLSFIRSSPSLDAFSGTVGKIRVKKSLQYNCWIEED